MKKSTILIFLLFTLKFSCYSQQTINGTIIHDGILRSYILYVPAIYSGNVNVPLLFNFHGYTSNANEQMVYGNFRPIADTANFIIVHPQGTLDNSGNTHFNVGWGGSTVNDVGFTASLIDSIAASYAIDQTRIYSVGMSNGGFMSLLLACTLSQKIAAVGSVAGSMAPALINSCNPTHSMPVIQIHGTVDQTVPYNGSAGWSASIPNVLNHWVTTNNCSSTPALVNMPNTNLNDGSTVEKYTYENGDNCTQVIHLKVINGQHTWPGSAIVLAGTNLDIKASKEVWNFLRNYNLNGLIGCGTASIDNHSSSSEFSVSPNPCTDEISISNVYQSNHYELFSCVGNLVMSGYLSAAHSNINISSLNPQCYLLRIGGTTIRIIKQ